MHLTWYLFRSEDKTREERSEYDLMFPFAKLDGSPYLGTPEGQVSWEMIALDFRPVKVRCLSSVKVQVCRRQLDLILI